MNELCKFGLFILAAQNGISISLQQTPQNQIPSEEYQGKNIFVQTYDRVTNGMYWIIVIGVIGYVFYSFSLRQVDNYRDTFKRLEFAAGRSDHTLYAELSNSAASFCSADFEGAAVSNSLVPTFALSEDDTEHFRGAMREVWALSKEANTRHSAMEILKREILDSRKLRHDLENNLEHILRENDALLNDKTDWTNRLRHEDFKMGDFRQFTNNGSALRQRVATLEPEERFKNAALRDHKAIQHKLAVSRSQIKELQQQVEELKIEKQTAIELVNKILFRNNSQSCFQNKKPLPLLKNDSSDDPPLDSCIPDLLRRNSCSDPSERYSCPQDQPRNCSHSDPLELISRLDALGSSFSVDPPVESSSGLDPPMNHSHLDPSGSGSCLSPLRNEIRPDSLLPGKDEDGIREEGFTHTRSLADAAVACDQDEDGDSLLSCSMSRANDPHCGEDLAKENYSKRPCDSSENPSSSLNACQDSEQRVNMNDIEKKDFSMQKLELNSSEISKDTTGANELTKLLSGGPVTSSPQFQQFLTKYCKEAKSA